jgi:hypothetical protein
MCIDSFWREAAARKRTRKFFNACPSERVGHLNACLSRMCVIFHGTNQLILLFVVVKHIFKEQTHQQRAQLD